MLEHPAALIVLWEDDEELIALLLFDNGRDGIEADAGGALLGHRLDHH